MSQRGLFLFCALLFSLLICGIWFPHSYLIKSRIQTLKVIYLFFKDNTVPHPPRMKKDLASWQLRHFPGKLSCSGIFLQIIPLSPLLSRHCQDMPWLCSGLCGPLRPGSEHLAQGKPHPGPLREELLPRVCPRLDTCSHRRDGLGAAAEQIKVTSTSIQSPAAPPSCSLLWGGSAYPHF